MTYKQNGYTITMTIDYEKLGRYYAAHETATALRDERAKLIAALQRELSRVSDLLIVKRKSR